MTESATPSTDNSDAANFDSASSFRWWDHEQARWIDRPATPRPAPVVDVRDMIVVHTALLREFRLLPRAVSLVPVEDRRRAARLDAHLGLLCDLLHHHHAGEDALLWPPLRARLPASVLAALEWAEAQHEGLEAALDSVAEARRGWHDDVGGAAREVLVEALQHLHRLLAEHLDLEERTLLPLAAVHLSEAEWHAIGEAGASGVPKSKMPLVFGMFAYEGDPEVLASMLAAAPTLPRLVVPLVAPRIYARHAARIHGTSRP